MTSYAFLVFLHTCTVRFFAYVYSIYAYVYCTLFALCKQITISLPFSGVAARRLRISPGTVGFGGVAGYGCGTDVADRPGGVYPPRLVAYGFLSPGGDPRIYPPVKGGVLYPRPVLPLYLFCNRKIPKFTKGRVPLIGTLPTKN
jgi:hypothetical protein